MQPPREPRISPSCGDNSDAMDYEANTEVRKKELFAKVRAGQVRVLMGSTFKMGAGMNVQDRLLKPQISLSISRAQSMPSSMMSCPPTGNPFA